MENVKERVKQSVMEWDVERLRSEMLMFVDDCPVEVLESMFFDDIATDEEYEELNIT
jgi:hypothetical protein